MTLHIKKVAYTSKGGYKIEWERPGAVFLTFEEAYSLMALLKGHLSQPELDKAFNTEEQAVIQRYSDLSLQKMYKTIEDYAEARSATRITQELKRLLGWLLHCISDSRVNLIEHFFGWNVPEEIEDDTDIFEDSTLMD